MQERMMMSSRILGIHVKERMMMSSCTLGIHVRAYDDVIIHSWYMHILMKL